MPKPLTLADQRWASRAYQRRIAYLAGRVFSYHPELTLEEVEEYLGHLAVERLCGNAAIDEGEGLKLARARWERLSNLPRGK